MKAAKIKPAKIAMIKIVCPDGEVVEAWPAYPAYNGAPGYPKGLYWEMYFEGQEEPFDEYLTTDVFDLASETLAPIA